MSKAEAVTYSPVTDEQRMRLTRAYKQMLAMPDNRWVRAKWVQLGLENIYFAPRDPMVTEKILNPRCGFCTAGMLIRLGLEELDPRPSEVLCYPFLRTHYGLNEYNVSFITRFNDYAFEHGQAVWRHIVPRGVKLFQTDAASPKEGGLYAISILLRMGEAQT